MYEYALQKKNASYLSINAETAMNIPLSLTWNPELLYLV